MKNVRKEERKKIEKKKEMYDNEWKNNFSGKIDCSWIAKKK